MTREKAEEVLQQAQEVWVEDASVSGGHIASQKYRKRK